MIHPAPPPTLPAATSPAQPIASVRWDGDAPVVIDQRIVGCDRVAANGDTANKIGTYSLAVLARRHGIPFYVAGPRTTFDIETADGTATVVEERGPDEVRGLGGRASAPALTEVWNPAFDVTPVDLIDAFVTDVGVIEPPYGTTIRAALERSGDVPAATAR